MDEMLSTHRLDFMIPTGRCEIQIKCARDQLIVLNFHDWIIVHKAVELTNKRSPDSFFNVHRQNLHLCSQNVK